METILQDIRYGLRWLRQSPGFTTVAVLTLVLGVGANTAMFSVINSVLLHSLPFEDPTRVMVLSKTMSNGTPNAFSTPAFLELRQQGGFLEHIGGFSNVGKNLGGKELPERIAEGKVNADLLPVLGVQPILGRTFSRPEDRPGAGAVAILSHALWSARLASRRDILGEAINLDGAPYTVVGVMPPGFHVLSDKELFWIPLQLESANAQASARNVHWLFAFTRPPQGGTQEQVHAGLNAIAARLKAQDPTSEGGFGATLQPVGDFTNGTILLRPLPFHDPQRLLALGEYDTRNGNPGNVMGSDSYANVADVRNRNHSLDDVAAYDWGEGALTGTGEPLHVNGRPYPVGLVALRYE